ncbi:MULTISPECIES: hypothetical protein [Calothrix]|uniref:Uncharacterized protein n=2 Tax=Calothrix TaxID=1186 RepID=A0ABR8A9I9_9CYAN|nr:MULTISPECIES: hypothetical protein [Calothrix]MBD2196607.1 hypothetical protein [Calothrix parietina FACHB-288]MBD2228028.1 hypothetical protein [Calothrix anomala FACHB-343]
MTPEEIQDLLKQTLGELKTEILSEVDKKNAGLASSLSKEIKKLTTTSPLESDEEPKGNLSLKALQQQISDLQTQLREKDEQAYNAKRSEAVSKAISKSNVLNQSTLHKLYMMENSSQLKEENGNWFVERNGQVLSLEESLKNYLNSDDGKLFLPPSGVNGSSSQETKVTAANPNTKVSAADALFDSISNL